MEDLEVVFGMRQELKFRMWGNTIFVQKEAKKI